MKFLRKLNFYRSILRCQPIWQYLFFDPVQKQFLVSFLNLYYEKVTNINFSPHLYRLFHIFSGAGYAQALGCVYILSYYVSIIALCLFYLVMSFQSTLPWAVCDDSWTDVYCVPADQTEGIDETKNGTSSAELYFVWVPKYQLHSH